MQTENLKSGLTLKGKFILTLRDLDGNIIKRQEIDNLVVNTGKYVYARLIDGDTTYSGAINYIAVGTGTNSPAITDTTLQTELARTNNILSQTRVNNVVTFEFYFGPTEAIGILKEVGAFIDGTAVVDSGQLFDRQNIDITKTAMNSLTIDLVVTVS